VARALIVGCGCHGRELGAELIARGWQVRGTARSPQARVEIDAAGIEAAGADPDRPGTVLDQVGDVAVVVWLLGSARGETAALEAIHGTRLERLLEKLVDTPVRGFVYEAEGGVESATLEEGARLVERAAATWSVPVAMLRGARSDGGWSEGAADTVEGVLSDRTRR
jgi:uncharacterized protein YbjT (DUF2867 family)